MLQGRTEGGLAPSAPFLPGRSVTIRRSTGSVGRGSTCPPDSPSGTIEDLASRTQKGASCSGMLNTDFKQVSRALSAL
ncbi:hypothetical protein Mal4_47530 [Maioricimonas rarisocia]|uniref:Uncharacterized protein n=1 Tax=Maioricimonas rarisocia TaxID=2528026 RepID=A0A517ZD52_9PLAN|nr:hypothetical protein Mal4_47530 [Maioricimonas rarisocia]